MKNRRVCFTGIGQVAILESDFTAPTPLFRDDLVLRTEYTLISPGTELDVLLGKTDNKNYPQCLGYSAVATVLQVGAEATAFQPGDRVLVYH
ncbi:MAG TPA: alcohol dehydrogenase catalytic domain-containing protein, partial [Lentisphaeria bacterium]|nr:alcohol dehydrogenase catalytic domain-containing protein [Lentisphaeria bacterium]